MQENFRWNLRTSLQSVPASRNLLIVCHGLRLWSAPCTQNYSHLLKLPPEEFIQFPSFGTSFCIYFFVTSSTSVCLMNTLLLMAIHRSRACRQFNEKRVVPLQHIAKIWMGNYLIKTLWKCCHLLTTDLLTICQSFCCKLLTYSKLNMELHFGTCRTLVEGLHGKWCLIICSQIYEGWMRGE